MSLPVRVSILGLIFLLAAALLWLGVVRYQAEQRAVAAAAQGRGDQAGRQPAARGGAGQAGSQAASAGPAQGGAAAGEPAAPSARAELQPAIAVHVAGAVANPGVYRLAKGARVDDAIDAAGGALPEGVPDALNRARPLGDGEKVYVATRQELEAVTAPPEAREATQAAGRGESAAPAGAAAKAEACTGSRANVNTGTAKELEAVKYIGQKDAVKIVSERLAHGNYRSLDELVSRAKVSRMLVDKAKPCLTLS